MQTLTFIWATVSAHSEDPSLQKTSSFPNEIRNLELLLELAFSFCSKCSQPPSNRHILSYNNALALVKKCHCSFVHVRGRMFLEGRGVKVCRAHDDKPGCSSSHNLLKHQQTKHLAWLCAYVQLCHT